MSRLGIHLRQYTEDERIEAVALGLAIGPVRAGEQLGIPKRNVSQWMHLPRFAYLSVESRERLDGLLTNTVALALREVEKGLQDPTVPLRQKAKAVEILGRQAAFMKMADIWVGMEKLLEEMK